MTVEGSRGTVAWLRMRQFMKLLQHVVATIKEFNHVCSCNEDFNDASIRGSLAKSGYLEQSSQAESDGYLRLEICHGVTFGVEQVHALPLFCTVVAT